MNKQQIREVNLLATYKQYGMTDVIARGMSALIRSAMTKKSKQELIAKAAEFGVTRHPEFII